MDINWLWLGVGLVPYSIQQHQMQDVQNLTAKALFWRLACKHVA